MGLRAMGIANDIVNMAFGITLGVCCGCLCPGFWLGRPECGRETTGELV